MAEERNVKIPEHTILSRLGRGGMASVYLARHDRLGRLVAVKVIDDRFDADEHFRQRFEREARTAAGLTHPNIVPVHEYGFTDDGRPFLTMAFLEGGSLRDRLQKRGPMAVDDALAVTRQVAAALLVAHSRNIVHRDLKPDNVLFQGDTALLTDFGIAKVLDASTALTGMGTNPGTVKYFSPEQAREEQIDQRSDIYTLGVVLYEMLTGHIPIEGETVMQLIMGIAQRAPDPLPPPLKGLQPFLDVMLAKDPNDRIGSCADVISIIQAMERNWLRFGEVDRLTDGVAMTTSAGRAAAPPPVERAVPAAPSSASAPTASPGVTLGSTGGGTSGANTDAATLLAPTGDPRNTVGATTAPPEAPLHDGMTVAMAPARTIEDEPLNDGQTVPMQRTPAAAPPPPPAAAPAPAPHAAQAASPISADGPPRPAAGTRPQPDRPVQGSSGSALIYAGIGALVLVGALVGYSFLGGDDEVVADAAASAAIPVVDAAASAAVAVAPVAAPTSEPAMGDTTSAAAATDLVAADAAAAQAEAEAKAAAEEVAAAAAAAKAAAAAAAAERPARAEPASGPPPREFLVGNWEFKGTELGEQVHVVWRATNDGTARYLLNPGKKNVLATQGTWTYSNGTLTEKFANGQFGSAEIRMVSRNEMVLRIVGNGDARYRGLERRYRRID